MAVSVHGLPLVMREGLEVAVVPPNLKGSRYHKLTKVTEGGAGQLIAFDDVKGLGPATDLVGKSLLVRVQDLPEDLADHDPTALIGRAVIDENLGELGAITEVMTGPAHDIWSVDGPLGQVLIPAVEAFVLGADEEGALHVAVPSGLVGLNGGPGHPESAEKGEDDHAH